MNHQIRKFGFMFRPEIVTKPRLVLISGSTGTGMVIDIETNMKSHFLPTGKSTLGMKIALSEGIMKCVSTDTIRQVVRSFDQRDAVHRSSYGGEGDPVQDWKETSDVLNSAILSVVDDAIKRNNSLVLEGVHLQPTSDILERWRMKGGESIGILLIVTDANAHRELIDLRGKFARKPATAQIQSFQRIRTIQEAMIEMANQSDDWMLFEQNLQPNPVDVVWKYFLERKSTEN
jgi:2-phosphoglycerate kinase